MAAGVSGGRGVEHCLWAPRVWLADGWADQVLLRIGSDGRWSEVQADVAEPPADAVRLRGAALPGLVDAHSHAFQRAFAGLGERRDAGTAHDDFWSWRQRMYAVAQRVTPERLRAIAAHLYVELLHGGYTQVCEFHYLQHLADGSAYDDPLALGWALADAAGEAGIGLTVLPVLYERAGFDGAPLLAEQRRFRLDADATWNACARIRAAGRAQVDAGLGVHSLRSAAPASIARLRDLAAGFDGPIHIHVAEQTREVEQCLALTGLRPVEWLARQPGLLDPRWQLVHATHVTPAEIDAVAAAGAGVVICPSTEANLGDGTTQLASWLNAGDGAVPLSIGSDSNATRSATEELRWLEYGQRLVHRERNVAAGLERGQHQPSSAARLWQRVADGGAQAAGARMAGIAVGARADLLVADPLGAAVRGVPASHLLDAMIFSSPGTAWNDVMVAGQWKVRDGVHEREAAIADRFEAAMQALWSNG